MTLVLYHFPNACSQVTLFALDAAQADHEVRLVNLRENEQASAEYAQVSPLGKVPVLMIDGAPLTENGALLTYLDAAYPDAGLFPVDPTPLGVARRVSALCFCSGTLHPIIRGILNPARLTVGDGGPVRSRSIALAQKNFACRGTPAPRRMVVRHDVGDRRLSELGGHGLAAGGI